MLDFEFTKSIFRLNSQVIRPQFYRTLDGEQAQFRFCYTPFLISEFFVYANLHSFHSITFIALKLDIHIGDHISYKLAVWLELSQANSRLYLSLMTVCDGIALNSVNQPTILLEPEKTPPLRAQSHAHAHAHSMNSDKMRLVCACEF